MSSYKRLILISLAALLAFGCSKKKEEAAELEKELSGKQDTVAEVMAPGSGTAPGTVDVSTLQQEPKPAYNAPVGSGYTLQVAGCEEREYAEFLLERYTQRGYEPYITSVTVQGQTFYRVRIGLFETLEEAKALKNELVDRYSIAAWIDYVQ